MNPSPAMSPLTLIHVLICLVAICSGAIVVYGLQVKNAFPRWTLVFLIMTLASCLTGYMFPSEHVTPAQIIGALGILFTVIAIVARYPFRAVGSWRITYVVTTILALYLNVFVLVAQAFQKIPALQDIAPTQASPGFLIAQTVVMVVFIALGFGAVKRFHAPQPALA